mmetsp:Transcript_6704/g.13089  ORF Transcript_6704/g.13089 Transcript_6704/m.13089 type:complete len:105 (-) Transcript_6704:385-699(-)
MGRPVRHPTERAPKSTAKVERGDGEGGINDPFVEVCSINPTAYPITHPTTAVIITLLVIVVQFCHFDTPTGVVARTGIRGGLRVPPLGIQRVYPTIHLPAATSS